MQVAVDWNNNPIGKHPCSAVLCSKNVLLCPHLLDFRFVYIDDLLFASDTWKDYLGHVSTTFEWLADDCLAINISKSVFALDSLDFFDYVSKLKSTTSCHHSQLATFINKCLETS